MTTGYMIINKYSDFGSDIRENIMSLEELSYLTFSIFLLLYLFFPQTLLLFFFKSSFFFHISYLSGAVHTGVEVRRMDSEMSGLVERPWLQLMCCAVCLPRGRNFR